MSWERGAGVKWWRGESEGLKEDVMRDWQLSYRIRKKQRQQSHNRNINTEGESERERHPDNPILMNERSRYMHLIVLWRTHYHSIYTSSRYIIQTGPKCHIQLDPVSIEATQLTAVTHIYKDENNTDTDVWLCHFEFLSTFLDNWERSIVRENRTPMLWTKDFLWYASWFVVHLN